VLTPNWSASLPTTLRAVPPPTRRCRGAPGRAAGHRGLHFSEEPEQQQSEALLRFGFSPSAGQDGLLLYPGPLCGGETGTTGRAAGVDKEVDSFSPGQEPCRKARPRLTDLSPRDGRQAPSGVAFLFGYFLFGHTKRK